MFYAHNLYINDTIVTSLILPHTIHNINDYAFEGCACLSSLVISECNTDTITYIGKGAFNGCTGLSELTLGNNFSMGMTSSGNMNYGPFAGCSNLSTINWNVKNCTVEYPFSNIRGHIVSFNFGDSVETIPRGLCSEMKNLESITFPSGLKNIPEYAFYGCKKLTSIVIPDSVLCIGEHAFNICSGLVSVSIGDNVTNIESSAFSGCKNLKSLTIGDRVTSIGRNAFYNCESLRSVIIPNSVTRIGNSAFYGCDSLRSVIIPNSVTVIGVRAFELCRRLDSITIGCNMDSIGDYAFRDCWNLKNATIFTQNPPVNSGNIFTNCSMLSSIFVPCGTLNDYKISWNNYADKIKYAPSPNKISFLTNYEDAGDLRIQQEASTCNDTAIIEVTPREGYHFVQWSDGVTDNPRSVVLAQDTTFIAEFAINQYTITWKNEYGSIIDQTSVRYGETPTHTDPVKESTAQYTYTFAGWTPEIVAVTGDATYMATFDAVVRKYMITFMDEDGTELCAQEWEYGATPSCAEPTKADDEQYTYTFAGWSPEVVAVTGEATYTATYTAKDKHEDFENVSTEPVPRKVMIDGQIYILRGDRVYTLQGQEVR